MSNDELFKALGMFEAGVKKAAVSSAINNAHQEVEQLNQQQMGLLEKRQAQTQMANSLAMRLAGMGADQGQIQTAVGAVGPAAIKNPSDMFQQALASGDEKAAGFAQKWQKFDNEPTFALQDDAQAATASEGAKNRASQEKIALGKVDKASVDTVSKQFEKLGTEAVNPTNRKTMGRYTQSIDNADTLLTLVNGVGLAPGQQVNPNESAADSIKRFNNATPQQIAEIVKGLDRLVSQAAPTVSGTEHLMPSSAVGKLNEMKQYLSNNPTGAGMGKFVHNIVDTVARERQTFAKKREHVAGKYKDIYKEAYQADPDRFMRVLAPEESQNPNLTGGGGPQAALPPGVPPGTPMTTFMQNGVARQGWKVNGKAILLPLKKQ